MRFVQLLLLLAPLPSLALQTPPWRTAAPDYEWAFPRDHYSHPDYRTEWWYVTGELAAEDASRRFAYQFTLFRIGLTPDRPALESGWAARALIMGHAALVDLDSGERVFSELLYRAAPLLGGFGQPGDTTIAWVRAPAGTGGRWTLSRTASGFHILARDDVRGLAIDLTVTPTKPRVFQGPNGYARKGDRRDAASLYYSYPRLDAEGTVRLGGDPVPVTGTGWMDREFGSNQLDGDQVGWDWFGLRLDDGRDVMVYLLRDSTGAVDFARATVVDPRGRPRFLMDVERSVRVTQYWQSPTTGARYPAGWRLRLPSFGLDLAIVPIVPEQENVSRLIGDLFYWEGAVAVRDADGGAVGRGFAELTGYGEASRPAI